MAATSRPLDVWGNDVAEELIRDVFDTGWARLNDYGVVALAAMAVAMHPVKIDYFGKISSGLDTSCWDALEEFTDEQLAELRAEYPSEEPEDGLPAAEINAIERRRRQERIAYLDDYARRYGLGPIQTCRQMIELLIAAGALHEHDGLIGPMYPLPPFEDAMTARPVRVDAGDTP